MEGLRHRPAIRSAYETLIVLVAALVAISLVADPAAARRRYTTDADSNSRGVDFSIRTVNSNGTISGTGSSGISCSYDLQFGNISDYSSHWKDSPAGTTLARKTCTDGTDDFVWVDPCNFVSLDTCPNSAPRVNPEALAREVRDHLPVPGIRIASNPRRGLVGLKSWFWLGGGGQPLADSLSRFGVRVEVEARPVSYRWEFGDGTERTTTSSGRPYPLRSSVTYTYQRSSAEFERGYPVSVTTVFNVRWRTNGVHWRSLPGISRTSERFYRVAESQTVNSDD
jgi:hypothetical protein